MSKNTFELVKKALNHPNKDAALPLTTFRNFQTCYDPPAYENILSHYLSKVEKILESQKTVAQKKSDIKALKKSLTTRCESAKYNAKIAYTITKILKDHSEFKSVAGNAIYPWTEWKKYTDILDYCRKENIQLQDTYASIPTVVKKLKNGRR